MLQNTPEGIEYVAPLLALLNIAISIPLILRKIPPNIFYGFRTRKTLSDSRIWYQANAEGGKNLVIASAVTLLCWGPVVRLFDRTTAPLINIGVFLVATIVAVSFSMAGLKKL